MELTWKAVYKNGESLNQYNEDGRANKYTDIDRAILKFFEIYKENKLIFKVHLEEGQKLIFRRRVAQQVFSGSKISVYLVGWQKNIKGENVQSIAYIFEDGRIELAGAWNEKSDWFYAPNLIKEEGGK